MTSPGSGQTRKYRVLRTALWTGNRVLTWGLRRGLPGTGAFALLETTGRRTGRPRRTPVGNGLTGDTFWLIAVHGDQSDLLRNIRRDPRVRVLVRGRWRAGVAVPMPDDDTAARSRAHPHPWDAAIGRALATSPMTVPIDLDPLPAH